MKRRAHETLDFGAKPNPFKAPPFTIAECKIMSEESLAEIVAIDKNIVSRMHAITVLYEMPHDASVVDQYQALLDFDVANNGGSDPMRVQRALEQRCKRKCIR